MAAWIPVTLFAAFVQNLRFMLQKHLKPTRLSTGSATFARFVHVKALGQVELIFSFLAATFWFRETTTGREVLAMALLSVSILALILAL